MLTPAISRQVRDDEQRIRSLALSEETTRFLIAKLYTSENYGLYTEAIEQLEALKHVENPIFSRLLGDLYVGVNLNALAEPHYLRALELSERVDDREGQAAALDMLGQIYLDLGNPAEAAARLQRAIEIYQTLGDAKKIGQLTERLGSIPKPA